MAALLLGDLVIARAGRDDGLTLIEIVVTMAIMSIAMAIFTTGVLQLYHVTNKTEAVALAQTQLNLTVLRLDKEIRYASGISDPGMVGADPDIEYLLTASGTPTCVELRLHTSTAQLRRRQWTSVTGAPATAGWRTLAFDVASPQPFTLLPPGPALTVQRLRLTMTARAGAGTATTTRQTDVTFSALNTTAATASATVCSEGRSVQ